MAVTVLQDHTRTMQMYLIGTSLDDTNHLYGICGCVFRCPACQLVTLRPKSEFIETCHICHKEICLRCVFECRDCEKNFCGNDGSSCGESHWMDQRCISCLNHH
jgi:hypothetical protein